MTPITTSNDIDAIHIYTVEESARVYIATTKQLTQLAATTHNTTPVATAALGRTLTAAAIMGAMLKNDTDLLTLTIRGDGPLMGMVVTADNRVNVKGYVYQNRVDIPTKPNGKLDVSGAIRGGTEAEPGQGYLMVTKDIGLKEPVNGSLALVSGEIAEDLTHYFAQSEQIPTVVGLGVLVDTDLSVKAAGGFIVQLLPGATDTFISKLETALQTLPSVTEMLTANQPILPTLFPDQAYRYHGQADTQFYCDCSQTKTEKALISVGKTELQTILAEDKGANVHCHFCNTSYDFYEADLERIIATL